MLAKRVKRKSARISEEISGYRCTIVLYHAADGTIDLNVRLDAHQMALLFDRDRSDILRHIYNIYDNNNLGHTSTCAKNAQIAADGKTRQMNLYNLDGNKRIAAALFLWFLEKNNLLYRPDRSKRIAENALVTITLMIAESEPGQKEILSAIVAHLIHDRKIHG